MAKALYRKWRPQDWDEVVAQEHIIETLKNAVAFDRVAHAYLFSGPRGTGKTTTARLLAKSVNCLDPDRKKRPCNECEHCLALNAGRWMDLIEIDAASNTSVDDVRDLREKINFSPSQGQFKIYIIDEVHMLSTAAFNALLKTLEEPPPHAIFVLATTEIQKIPATVLSRCQRYEFRPIPIPTIVELLKQQSQKEGIQVDEPVYTEIARQATGSLRDAISLLDQLTSTGDRITLEMAQSVLGTATSESIVEIVTALLEKDSAKGLLKINQALESGTDPIQLARQVVTYLRNMLLLKMNNDDQVKVSDALLPIIKEHASKIPLEELLNVIDAFNKAITEKHANWHPGLGLELAFTSYLVNLNEIPSSEGFQETMLHDVKPKTSQPTEKKPVKVEPQTPAVKEQNTTQKKPAEGDIEPKPSIKEPIAEDSQPETDKKEPPPAIEEKSEAQPEIDISLSELHRLWPEIKHRVGTHNRRTEGLLNTAKIAGLRENTLFLGFTSDTLKGMMQIEGNINLTSDVLEEFFKQPILVKCIVTTSQTSAIPDDRNIDKDGMVGTATRDLGGKISKAEEVND